MELLANTAGEILDLDNVISCGPTPSSLPILNVQEVSQVANASSSQNCDLFLVRDANHDYRSLSTDSNLTPFWAQEYIGSDLLREEMSDRGVDTSQVSSLLGVWDTSQRSHGEFVSNLIVGPHPSSLLTSPEFNGYTDLLSSSGTIEAYEQNRETCEQNSNCPRFINNSMSWGEGDLVRQTVERLSDENIVFITAAGNDATQVLSEKIRSAREGHSIIVASHAPNGLSSGFTNFAPEVTVSAPSDDHILSFDRNGNPRHFGGTSGAAPLVTSTSLAFELIAGVELSTSEYSDLLQRTAIRHRYDPARRVTGAGYLNSYKMGAVAFRLVERCREHEEVNERNECMMQQLERGDLYDFSGEVNAEQIIRNVESAFPACSESEGQSNQNLSCQDRRSALRELRRASFLIPESAALWGKLACISREEGFSTNAEYYSRLARGRRLLTNELASTPISNADVVELLGENEELQNSSDFFMSVVRNNGLALQYASEALRSDREIVLLAVREVVFALNYTSEALINDRDFILEVVRENGHAILYAPDALRNDREVVLAAVRQDGHAIQHASDALKNDREIVLAAVRQNVHALQYASEALNNDRDFIMEVVRENGYALEYASEALQNDRDFILEVVRENGHAILYAPDALRNDRDFALEAVRLNRRVFRWLPLELKNDPEIRAAYERR